MNTKEQLTKVIELIEERNTRAIYVDVTGAGLLLAEMLITEISKRNLYCNVHKVHNITEDVFVEDK